jgi:hypothetical protein
VLDALKILQPETVIRWHRAGFRVWRWRSRRRGGRPSIPADIRHLILEMSVANPLWGAPRIHGELLKVGIDVGQTTVANTWPAEGGHRRPLELSARLAVECSRVPTFIFLASLRDPMFCERGSPRHPIGRCYLRTIRRLGTYLWVRQKTFYNTIYLMANLAQTWWQRVAAERVIRQRATICRYDAILSLSEVVGDDRIG